MSAPPSRQYLPSLHGAVMQVSAAPFHWIGRPGRSQALLLSPACGITSDLADVVCRLSRLASGSIREVGRAGLWVEISKSETQHPKPLSPTPPPQAGEGLRSGAPLPNPSPANGGGAQIRSPSPQPLPRKRGRGLNRAQRPLLLRSQPCFVPALTCPTPLGKEFQLAP